MEAYAGSRGDCFWGRSGRGLFAPIIGYLIDRYGGRKIALWGLVGVAAGYFLASASGGALWYFYFVYAAVALLGAGGGPVSWTRAVAGHFHRWRGLALALTLSGTGLAAIFVPPYAVYAVGHYGWRGSYVALAFLPIVALVLAAFFFIPGRATSDGAVTDARTLSGFTLREAISSYRFWLLLASILTMYIGITGIVPNLIPALTDKGFTPAAAASILSGYDISLIIARLGIGWLLDRFWGPGVAAVTLTSPVVACMILMGNPSYVTAMLASVLAAAAGAELDLLAFFAARYFGLRHYGRIYGLLYTGVALGAGLGPISFAHLSQLTGSYTVSFRAALALFAFGEGSILFLGRYPEGDEGGETQPA